MRHVLKALILLSCLPGVAIAAGPARGEDTFDFGRTLKGSVIEHSFRLTNDGQASLRIQRLLLTPPVTVVDMPQEILPDHDAALRVRLETVGLAGAFEGRIIVEWSDLTRSPTALTLTGYVFPPIEVLPLPAFFVSAVRGEAKHATLEVLNHESAPLEILKIEHPTERFTTALETVDPGRRYRLTLTMRTDGPAGRRTDMISLHTSSPTRPVIRVPAHTYIKERVYTFPEAVDLGTLRLADIKAQPDLLQRTTQTLMVYQSGGTDFQVAATSDLACLRLHAERGPQGDRYQTTVQLDPERVQAGIIHGTITIRTNDPQFPELRIPVTGQILNE